MAALENLLVIGDPVSPLFTFENAANDVSDRDGIVKIGGLFAVDVSGDELSVDTVTAIVQLGRPALPAIVFNEIYLSPGDEIYVDPNDEIYYAERAEGGGSGQQGYLTEVPYGTPVRWWCDGRLVASFYWGGVSRQARYLWAIKAVSGVGLLDKLDHAGGVYTGQTVSALLTSIINGAFPYTVAPALADQQIYGWLPYDSARNNLHRLLVSMGSSMRRDESGEVTFVFLSASEAAAVPDNRVAFGGSVNYETPATRYEVTEHAYAATANDETVTLYDNSSGGALADNTLVRFNAGGPVHDLAVTGTLTINESGVNHAVVSGVGTLTGKLYTHITRIVAAETSGTPTAEKILHLREDFTLVSIANSMNVAQRMLSYYSGARTVACQLLMKEERCGDVLSLNDPFFESITAFLRSANVNASSTLLGSCELIEGYEPNHQGNNVTGNETLTGTGTWVSPFTGTLTVLVAAGGTGGGAGNAGQDAPVPSVSSYSYSNLSTSYHGQYLPAKNAKAGKGGAAGTPGNGGKIYVTAIQVTEGQEIAYRCGVGGAGEVFGTSTGGAGGTATTFGAVSSDSGAVYPAGYPDPISGALIGGPGHEGVDGGDGVGFLLDDNNIPYLNVPDPISVNGVNYSAGAQGNSSSWTSNVPQSYGYLGASAKGGYGGGAAYKANGNKGGNGSYLWSSGSSPYVRAISGIGGKGATAQAAPKSLGYGQGGHAGNGGGGGGAYGTSYISTGGSDYQKAGTWAENRNDSGSASAQATVVIGTPAQGGNGSDGGEAGDGVIRLFWGE